MTTPRRTKPSARRLPGRGLFVVLAAAALVALDARAQASVPYTPSVAARHAIQVLVDDVALALPTTQWPLPLAAVQSAVDALPADLPAAADRARDQLRAELRRREGAQLELALARRVAEPVGFGDAAVPGSAAALRSPTWGGDGSSLRLQLGVRATAGTVPAGAAATTGLRVRLDDSAAVADAGGVLVQAWSRRSGWGPGWQDSLVLGHNAPALVGLGVQRAGAGVSASPWLSWLGAWNAEFFVARLDGHTTPASPWLIGNRLTLRPWSGTELGLTRTAQWGGAGRDQSARGFVSMLFGRGTNADTVGARARDPGNQMAGFDLRQRCPTGLRCAGYLQLIGEDMAGVWPSRYLSLYGIETWSADATQRWFAEYVRSSCDSTPDKTLAPGCAYRNGQYPDGYAHAQRWLGAGFGPDARVLTLGWLHAPTGTSLRLHAGVVDLMSANAFEGGTGAVFPIVRSARARLRAVQAQRDWAWAGGVLTPRLGWQGLSSTDGLARLGTWSVGLQWQLSLERGADLPQATAPLGG